MAVVALRDVSHNYRLSAGPIIIQPIPFHIRSIEREELSMRQPN
jgi:hypothetical protein